MRRLPPFPALRAFESAARQLSFTRAAEELYVTPSAISHQVRLLEKWVGTPLFEREVRRVRLTQRGRELYISTSKSLDDLAIAFRVAEHRRAGDSPRRVRVCGDAGFIEWWLARRLGQYLDATPGKPVDVYWGRTAEDYKRCRADIVVHYGRADRLPFEPISQWRFHEFVVCSPRLITKAKPLSCIEDLARHRLLHELGTEPWIHWLTWVGADSVDWVEDGPIYFGDCACLKAVVAGQGVALTDELVGSDLLMSGELIKPLGETRESDFTLTLLARKEALDDPAAMSFIEWLRHALEAHRASSRRLVQQTPFRARPRRSSRLA